MTRSLLGALVALVLLGGVASAQTTTTTTTLQVAPPFPPLSQPQTSGGRTLQLAKANRCNTTPCDTGPFSIMVSQYPGPAVYFDCAGTCVASIVCRMPGSLHDVSLAASGTLTDAAGVQPIARFCPRAYLSITTCTTCNLSAWLVNAMQN